MRASVRHDATSDPPSDTPAALFFRWRGGAVQVASRQAKLTQADTPLMYL